MKRLKNNKGQSMVEYMIIVALMAVSTMGIMRVLSQTTSGKLAKITQSLQGGKAQIQVKFEKINQSDVRKKDMSNFFEGARSRKNNRR